MGAKDSVKMALETLLTDVRRDAATIAAHFAPDYRQWVDGETLELDGFVATCRRSTPAWPRSL